MNRDALPLISGFLLLTLGCGDPTGPVLLQPNELCSDHDATAIATFEDANLEAAVRRAPGFLGDLTCLRLASLGGLPAHASGIVSLVGIQNFGPSTLGEGLLVLLLGGNSITDISPLGGLTSLTFLALDGNTITDIGALSGLTNLEFLSLRMNPITNFQPVLDNTGLGEGDTVEFGFMPVSCTVVTALQARGVTVKQQTSCLPG